MKDTEISVKRMVSCLEHERTETKRGNSYRAKVPRLWYYMGLTSVNEAARQLTGLLHSLGNLDTELKLRPACWPYQQYGYEFVYADDSRGTDGRGIWQYILPGAKDPGDLLENSVRVSELYKSSERLQVSFGDYPIGAYRGKEKEQISRLASLNEHGELTAMLVDSLIRDNAGVRDYRLAFAGYSWGKAKYVMVPRWYIKGTSWDVSGPEYSGVLWPGDSGNTELGQTVTLEELSEGLDDLLEWLRKHSN